MRTFASGRSKDVSPTCRNKQIYIGNGKNKRPSTSPDLSFKFLYSGTAIRASAKHVLSH